MHAQRLRVKGKREKRMGRITMDSPIGRLCLMSDERGICEIALMEQTTVCPPDEPDAVLHEACRQLEAYFAGTRTSFDLPLSLHGSAFDCAVWQQLCMIGFAQVRTYGQVAAMMGRPKAARAVGAACSRNPVLIAVPCHRVVAGTGKLTGFAAGMAAKRTLLVHEGWTIHQDALALNK